jgi:uncharacterized protein
MFEIPLFPLSTVLFPTTPVHLHIFESRYLQMIRKCIQHRLPFGVVLIQHGREALGPLADPYLVGCTAEIVQVEKLSQERLNIIAIGRERFQIRSLDSNSHPYLVGRVDHYPLQTIEPSEFDRAGKELRLWVERYYNILMASETVSTKPRELPADTMELAYLAASLLQSSPVQKQSLLEVQDDGQFYSMLLSMLRREIALLQSIKVNKKASGQEPFSSN